MTSAVIGSSFLQSYTIEIIVPATRLEATSRASLESRSTEKIHVAIRKFETLKFQTKFKK